MALQFHPLPVELFPEETRPYLKRLNFELRDLFGLEGTIRQPITDRRSDLSVTRGGALQVHVDRITPSVASVVSGVSTVVGVPSLTLSTTNVVGSTTSAISTNSTIALFGTGLPAGLSASAIVGTSAFAARADHIHAGFDATVPAAIGSSAATGTVDFAARRDHAHLYPIAIRSTANASTLTLTDDATDQFITGSLGLLNITPGTGVDFDFPNSTAGALNVRANTTTAATFLVTVAGQPTAGTRTLMVPNWFGASAASVFASQTFRCWDAQFATWASGQITNSTIVGFDASNIVIAPSSGSSSGNNLYGFRTLTFIINNANASWADVAGAYIRGARRTVVSPKIDTQAALILEPPTGASTTQAGSTSSQIGLLIRQQTAQVTALDRIAIQVDAQNSGTNRYAFYGVSDILYHGGDIKHTGSRIGLHNVGAGVTQSTGWSTSGFTASKTLNGASFSLNEVMSVLNTLVTHLVNRGDLAA